jgi:hypothetical protein
MSPSTRISHACAPATAPKTWPWSATSPSIWAAAESAPHREAGAVDLEQARDTYAALLPTSSEARRKELRALVDTVVITVDDITDLRHHLDQRIEAVWGKNRRRTRRTIQEQVAEN